MKEKFTKLFGALILVALVLGLVMPFQTAAAQAEVPESLVVTVTAGNGVALTVDNLVGGVPVTMTTGTVASGTGTGAWATYTLWYSTTESGAKTMVASGILPGTRSASYQHAAPTQPAAEYTVPGLTPGKKYWFWAAACDTTTACTPQFGGTGYPRIHNTGADLMVSPGYDNLPVTMTTTTTSGLVAGTIYKIFRQEAAAPVWPTTPATATAFLTSTSPLIGQTVQLYDQTAAGWLLDETAAKLYAYKLDICGPDYCASQQEGGFAITDLVGNQRTKPAKSVVTASDTTTDGKVYVTWSGSPSTGNTTYYAQRQFGAIFEPAVPVSFDQFTFNGVDSWAVANNVYTYWLWSCSGGTQNCSDDATNPGGHVGTSAVAGLTASDGTATDSSGNAVVQVLFPAVTNTAVTQYFAYRTDDAAGTIGLTLFTPAIAHVAGATLGFVDDNANLGQDYYYWVVACGEGNDPALGAAGAAVCGAKSNVDTGWAPITQPTLTLTNSTSGVSATWNYTDVNITYLGFRSPTSSFSAAIPVGGVAIPGLSGTDTSGVAGTTYYYFLKACLGTRCSVESVAKPGIKLMP